MEAEKSRFANAANWFFTLFGSAILGTTILLVVTIFNNLYQSVNDYRTESCEATATVAADVSKLRERLSAMDEQKATLNEKVVKMQELSTEIIQCKEKLAAVEALQKAAKDRSDSLEQANKELKSEIQMLREKLAVLDSQKK